MVNFSGKLFAIFLVTSMLCGASVSTLTVHADSLDIMGFSKGVSARPLVPMKQATFVHYDNKSFLDDYAYLAAVPSAVFHDSKENLIYTQPLLFYQDEYDYGTEDAKRTLNAYQGIDYFMDDWMGYTSSRLDELTLINLPQSKLDANWKAKEYSTITGEDPFSIAGTLAQQEWSYADKAVVAVIEESYDKPTETVQRTLDGSLSPEQGVLEKHFEVPQTKQVYPIYSEFNVPEGYKFLKVRSWYPSFYLEAGVPGFEGIINMSIPAGDRDIQIYYQHDNRWMMAGITSAWNAQGGMDLDKISIYAYEPGKWSVGLTDVPTKDELGSYYPDDDTQSTDLEPQKHHHFLTFDFGRYGTLIDILRNMRQVTYNIDVEMFPGVMIDLPDIPKFGCSDATFELSWDNPNIDLGFSLIGPSDEEVLSTREPGVPSSFESSTHDEGIPYPPGTETDLHVEKLGECLPGEHYSICVFAMNDIETTTDFTLEYSWGYNMSRKEGNCLASATEGAVLGSVLNAPLLYTTPSAIPEETLSALYTLGVKDVYLVNLGDYLSDDARAQLDQGFTITDDFTSYESIYTCIRDQTGSNDVIFSTINPWSYWYVAELKPEGEMNGSLFIGPAAYIAAQHGTPVLLIDNHPELSTAVIWHNELWRRHPDGHTKLPTVSEMYLTGTRVYNFLKEYGFDKEGEETIITIAGQFDVGLSWDRMFVGKAKPGRFIGSPTDASVWIAKNVFYPMLIFENPALKNSNGVELINGSSSKRRFPWRGTLGLKITKPSQTETFMYPVLDTLICYDHKFNTRASQYWGFEYICADGTVPGTSPSTNPIDEGVMLAVNGEPGAFFPDLSGSEVQPFYLKKGGYTPVYSTNFDANMEDLNNGVLLWLINTHGAPTTGGMLMFWDVTRENPNGYPPIPLAGYKKETNPWRGYEWLVGSTTEPDTMTSEIHGIIPALLGDPEANGFITTALDWALAYRPIRDMIGKLASLPIIRHITPEWLQNTQDYYDGIIIAVFLARFGTSWYNGIQVDDSLENIHSTGVSSVACLPAGKYLHLTLMRHGSPFQIMDPWATSWYSDVWQNSVPRGIALGETIGEIYSQGISKVGILYISDEEPQWWWDLAENVCLYGDPNLRPWVPSTEFSDNNHWTIEDVQPLRYDASAGFMIDGHTPYGAVDHPHKTAPATLLQQYLPVIIAIVLIIVLLLAVLIIGRRKKA
jgi:hypothetical protein